MELERAQEVRDTIEAPTRAQGRDELHAWILDQISMGLIEDRASMLDALADAGFDLPRVGKAYPGGEIRDTHGGEQPAQATDPVDGFRDHAGLARRQPRARNKAVPRGR